VFDTPVSPPVKISKRNKPPTHYHIVKMLCLYTPGIEHHLGADHPFQKPLYPHTHQGQGVRGEKRGQRSGEGRRGEVQEEERRGNSWEGRKVETMRGEGKGEEWKEMRRNERREKERRVKERENRKWEEWHTTVMGPFTWSCISAIRL
jgi:hypothetical protein